MVCCFSKKSTKKKTDLLDYVHRIKMVRIAVEGYKKMSVLDIESECSPSYTIHTLDVIEKKYPKDKFTLIIGRDTLYSLKKWKSYKIILNKYDIFVYPRIGFFSNPFFKKENIYLLKAPMIEISSSFIRNSIQKGKNIKPLLQPKVWKYMKKHKFYRK